MPFEVGFYFWQDTIFLLVGPSLCGFAFTSDTILYNYVCPASAVRYFFSASGNETIFPRVYGYDGKLETCRPASFLHPFLKQNTNMKNTKSHWWLLVCVALLAYACDIINKDGKPQPTTPDPEGTVLYTTPKNGLVMNLLTMDEYKNATGFKIGSQPNSGRVSFVKEATLLYTPDTTKNVKSDYFLLKISTGDSTKSIEKVDTVVIKFVPKDSIPCRSGVRADGYLTQSNKSLIMNVLENDYFCKGSVDSSSLSVQVQPKHGTLSIRSDHRLVYTPAANYEGYDYFIYKVCNNDKSCGEAPVKILIQKRDSSNCPGARPDSYTFPYDSIAVHTLNILANDQFCTDSIDRNSITIVSQPKHGRIVTEVPNFGRPMSIAYQHFAGFSGTDYFRYRVCTVTGKCAEADVKINIQSCTNVLVNDTLLYKVSSPSDSLYTNGASINILQNDKADCPIVTIYEIAIANQPKHGTARMFGGQLVYKANPGFKGKDIVEYGLCVIGNPQSCTQKALVYIDIR